MKPSELAAMVKPFVLRWIGEAWGFAGRWATADGQFVTMAADARLTHARVLTAGAGIEVADGGAGSLVAVGLEDTAVTPDTYGDGTHVAQVTVDAKGRVTAASEVAITAGGAPVWTVTTDDDVPTEIYRLATETDRAHAIYGMVFGRQVDDVAPAAVLLGMMFVVVNDGGVLTINSIQGYPWYSEGYDLGWRVSSGVDGTDFVMYVAGAYNESLETYPVIDWSYKEGLLPALVG